MPLISSIMQGGQGDIQPLDLMIFATPEKIFGMIEKYGEATRSFYRTVELTVDIIYPVIYLFAFGLTISWLFQRGFNSNSKMMKLNVIPLGAWFFDLLENLGIITMLSIYPAAPTALAWALFVLTITKWAFAAACVVLMLVGLAMALKNGFKKQG